MLTATIKGMLAHKLRLALTALSIALGVGFLAGTLMLTDSMQRAFDDIFGKLTAGTDVVVRGEGGSTGGDLQPKPVPSGLLATIRSVPGVAAAEGQVSGYALLTDVNGKPVRPGSGAPALGSSLPRDADLRGEVSIHTGRAPDKPGEVAIDATSAKSGQIPLGSRIKILFRGPAERFTVVGTVQFAGKDDLGGSTAAYFEPSTAQRVLGQRGTYDAIAVRGVDGVSDDALATRVGSVLPHGVEAVTGQALAEESSRAVTSQFTFFNDALLVFAGIALFVGSFIIWNTFSMQVTQRTRELALIRAIGATRRQVMRTVLVEALVLGLGASVLGLGLGVGVARGLPLVMSALGLDLPTAAPRLQVGTVLAALLVGTLVTLVAAIAPARRATRVLPVEAMRDATPIGYRFSRRRLVTGSVVTVTGVAALAAALVGGASPAFLAVGMVAVFLGVTSLAPLVARPLASVIGAPLRARGIPGELARQNAMRNPKRTASTAMALMIGVTMVASVSVLAASLKASFHDVLGKSAKAELYLETASMQAEGFSPDVAKAVRSLDGVAVVSETGFGRARFAGGLTRFSSVDPATVDQVLDLGMAAGRAGDLTDDGVLVSKQKADAQHWKIGDRVPAEFGQTGAQQLTVKGIFTKKSLFNADYLISLTAHDKQDPARLDTSGLVKLDPGADAKAVQDKISSVLAAHPDTRVLDRKGVEKAIGGDVDKILALIVVMLLLAVLIALLGIVNTMALSVFERTRELGLLRAVGMTRNQVRAMVRWESVVISLIGAGVGAVLGTGLGVALTRLLEKQGISSVAIPGRQLSVYVALAAVAGVLAAIGPARRAAKVDVLRAVVTE